VFSDVQPEASERTPDGSMAAAPTAAALLRKVRRFIVFFTKLMDIFV
jgi:hypothetical protein